MSVLELPEDTSEGILAFMRRYHQLERLEAGWRDQAACAQPSVPPLRHFFPDATSAQPGALKVRRARRACALCPVRRPCLTLALGGELVGIWAGTTDAQRRDARRVAPERRLDVLLQRARRATVTGPWRVASAQEWDAA